MNAQFGMQKHIGQRSHQEDHSYYDSSTYVFGVADGMGGHAGGRRASEIIVEQLASLAQSTFNREPPPSATGSHAEATSMLKKLLMNADKQILSEVSANPRLANMGTTAIIGILCNGCCSLAHCGDSRAYFLRADILTQETKDHSLVQFLIDQGLLTAAQARSHPRRNVIMSHVGGRLTVDELKIDLLPGDVILLCTDGLTDVLPDTSIHHLLRQGGSAQQVANRLVSAAVAAGASDNVTALIIVIAPASNEAKPRADHYASKPATGWTSAWEDARNS